MKNYPLVFMLISLFSCAPDHSVQLDFMQGTWKREDKNLYEVWERQSETEFTGYSYKLEEGEKVILETLRISNWEGQIVLEATVPDQNEGNTVPFTLNPERKGLLSFENEAHDFPKMIQYRKISDTEMEVNVRGAEGEGFSYIQMKQN